MTVPETVMADPRAEGGAGAGPEYPTSDGLALLGTSWHEDAVFLAREALNRHFRGRERVFVATLMALYYERGRRRSHCLIPDLLVALGVPGHGRRVYKLWEEGKAPDFVLEVASATTVHRDCGFKKGEYERIGVREYWQLDQTGHLLDEPLLGHRLRRGRYERLGAWGQWQGVCEYRSVELGLLLRGERRGQGLEVAFRDAQTGDEILTGEAIDRALRDRDRMLHDHKRMLRDRDRMLRDKDRTLRDRDRVLCDHKRMLRDKDRTLRDRDRVLRDHKRMLRDRDRTLRAAEEELCRAQDRVAELTRMLHALKPSE